MLTICLLQLLLGFPTDCSAEPLVRSDRYGKNCVGWKLVQKQIFNGHQTIYLFPATIKIENHDLGYTLILDSGKNTANIFSNSKKLRCSIPIEKFHNSVASTLSIAGECPAGLPWSKTGGPRLKEFGDLSGRWYSADEAKNIFAGSKHGGYLAGARRIEHVQHLLFVTNSIVVDPALKKIICQLQGEPQLGGVSLMQYSRCKENGKTVNWLTTEHVEKVKWSQVDWKIPAFKVADQSEIISSGESNMIEDLFN